MLNHWIYLDSHVEKCENDEQWNVSHVTRLHVKIIHMSFTREIAK